jgi:hypothetical protein
MIIVAQVAILVHRDALLYIGGADFLDYRTFLVENVPEDLILKTGGARRWSAVDDWQSIAEYRRAASTGNIVIIRPK